VLDEGVPHAPHPGCWHTALGLSAGMWWIPSPSKDVLMNRDMCKSLR